jgi:hypothetical protein
MPHPSENIPEMVSIVLHAKAPSFTERSTAEEAALLYFLRSDERQRIVERAEKIIRMFEADR